ncbi:MAG: VanZ family protein [Rubritalea sp.]|uniref:VanZ family protein n=1 Tax=Rubritalea sp. TaxID=2109375 RepID=UPI0032420EA1
MLRRLTRLGKEHPEVWIIAWAIWLLSLWFLSAGTQGAENTPDIPHLDKVAHFGYFFGGGGLLCGWLRHQFSQLSALRCITITTLVCSLVGIMDEYHQTFTPGRLGNDFGDWLADTLGSLSAAVVMIIILKYTATWSNNQSQSFSR